MTEREETGPGPLAGLHVLEIGSFVAGPFATRLMAEFGAEVVKIETPGQGDTLRHWRHVDPRTGNSLWWSLQARNKKLITLNLKHPDGLELGKRLIVQSDVLVENLRPGALERLGLGWEVLHDLNPRLILVRISGFGQTGPYRDRGGFGNIGEAMGGIRYVTGEPGGRPVRPNLSLGDSLAGLYAVIGALMALQARDRRDVEGQVVDVALTEAVFSLMDSSLPEYDVAGTVRERTGGAVSGVAPTNTYRTGDGRYIAIGANSDALFVRLAAAMNQPDLAQDPRFSTNRARAEHMEELDDLIGRWTAEHTLDNILHILEEAGVPAGPIYSIADIAADEQFRARDMILDSQIDGIGRVAMPGIVPKLSNTPGAVNWYGGEMGGHNWEIFGERLGLTAPELDRLAAEGVI